MTLEPMSTDDVLREVIYNYLRKEFSRIEAVLEPNDKTELDGILWKHANVLSRAGMWESIQRMYGMDPEIKKAVGQ